MGRRKRLMSALLAVTFIVNVVGMSGRSVQAQERKDSIGAVCAEETIVAESSAGNTPVAQHGRLRVEGTNIKDEAGQNFQLRGVSTHGINWDVGRPYVTQSAFQTLRDDWGANAVRLAMYTSEYNGYCTGGNQTELKNLLYSGVQSATNLGMYAVIDWHILNDGNPNIYLQQSKSFWNEVSAKYKNQNNVIYEICNEPNGCSWDEIKNYANQIIPIIRANDPNAVIIVGTPTWSQLGQQGHTNEVADSPLTGYSNLVYSLHFYCAESSHTQYLPAKVDYAVSRGLPVLVSEFGLSQASGDGNIDTNQATNWLNKLDNNYISYFAWSLSNKNESSALIQASVSKTSGWSADELTPAGQWIRTRYRSKMVNEALVGQFVTRLYEKCLGRQPETAGLTDWKNRLCSGSVSGTSAAYGFVFSQEYQNKNTTDEQYVEMLYQVFLDRASDAGGKANWLQTLKQGVSREYVFRGFAESAEFTNICSTYGIARGSFVPTQPRDQNLGVTSFVSRLYTKALERNYEIAGLDDWCNRIVTGQCSAEAAAEGFINSQEYKNKNLSNTEYVKNLYRTFFNREYDQAGFDHWVSKLNAGESRVEVLHGFSRSQEFHNLMSQYGL